MTSRSATMLWAIYLTFLGWITSCTSPKTPYVSDAREPNDLPPSPRYTVVLMALRDELPRHGDLREFYLCQGPEQVAALQRDLPVFTLRHVSETYSSSIRARRFKFQVPSFKSPTPPRQRLGVRWQRGKAQTCPVGTAFERGETILRP